MKKFVPCALLVAVCVLLNQQALRAEERSFTVKCGRKPTHQTLISRAIREKVLALIDGTRYTKPSSAARVRLVQLHTEPVVRSASEVVNGLTFTDENSPAGLAFSVAGTAQFDEECVYTYQVILTTSGRDITTGKRAKSKTTSTITIKGPMDGTAKRNPLAGPTPTPTVVPTATPTP